MMGCNVGSVSRTVPLTLLVVPSDVLSDVAAAPLCSAMHPCLNGYTRLKIVRKFRGDVYTYIVYIANHT